MDPAPHIEPHTEAAEAKRWLRSLSGDVRGPLRAAVMAGTLAGLFTVVQMGFLAAIVQAVLVDDRPVASLTGWFAALLAAVLLRTVAQGLQTRSAARGSAIVQDRIRRQLLASWANTGPVRLMDTSAGTLAREWLDHVAALHGYFARFQPQMWLSVISPLIILAVVLRLDWLAATFLILSAPLIPLFMALVGMGADNVNQRHFETVARLSGFFLDRVRGLTTLQLFGQTDSAAEAIRQRSDQYRRLTMETLRIAFLSSAVLEFFSSVAIAVVAIYIGFGLLGSIQYGPAAHLTLFSGLFILLLAPEFFQPLRQLSQHYHDRASALGAARLLLDRIQAVPAPGTVHNHVSPQTVPVGHAEMAVTVDDVSLIFPNGRPGLLDVSLTVPTGSTTVLSGPSGGGKSTLLHVIAGFLWPDNGTVSVLGAAPGQAPFGWLGQSPFLQQGSWADNLRLVAPTASDAQITDALVTVGLGSLVAHRPEGIHSAVAESGAGLSGGQARRLSLARCFLADYPLILLDEPTAGLDPASEQQVIKALAELAQRGKTLVISTHHATVLTMADALWLVERGGVRHA